LPGFQILKKLEFFSSHYSDNCKIKHRLVNNFTERKWT